MPIMPNGNFLTIEQVRNSAKTLRNMLSYAERKEALTHPAALEWKRELAELEDVIADFDKEMAA